MCVLVTPFDVLSSEFTSINERIRAAQITHKAEHDSSKKNIPPLLPFKDWRAHSARHDHAAVAPAAHQTRDRIFAEDRALPRSSTRGDWSFLRDTESSSAISKPLPDVGRQWARSSATLTRLAPHSYDQLAAGLLDVGAQRAVLARAR